MNHNARQLFPKLKGERTFSVQIIHKLYELLTKYIAFGKLLVDKDYLQACSRQRLVLQTYCKTFIKVRTI
jgi:hypothetical protein